MSTICLYGKFCLHDIIKMDLACELFEAYWFLINTSSESAVLNNCTHIIASTSVSL